MRADGGGRGAGATAAARPESSGRPPPDARVIVTRNPATGEVLAEIPAAQASDVEEAVRRARRAFGDGRWSRAIPDERARVLWRIAEGIERHADELARLETLDNGKPIRAAREIDVPQAASYFRYQAGCTAALEGETIETSWRDHLNYTLREPYGVVAQIIPWNFPLVIAARNLSAALACRNSVILKPSEETPLTALRLAEIMAEAGLPEDVAQVLPGYGPVAGAALAGHPDVDRLHFCGGHEAARAVVRASAGNFKRLSLELGGKSPHVILPDADLERAVASAAAGCFSNMGESCSAGSRVFVHRDRAREVTDGLAAAAEAIRLGPGLDPATEMGPLISPAHRARVAGFVERARAAGVAVATGGAAPDEPPLDAGWFYRPTVLVVGDDAAEAAREEIFGPVVGVFAYRDEDELVARANATRYGLAAGVWTRDLSAAHRLAARLRAGVVWVNGYDRFDAASPFGGVGESGYGRDMGRHAIEEYTAVKSVWINYGP